MSNELEVWTTRECADYLGVKVHTFRGYVNQGDAPQPIDERSAGNGGTTHLFDAAAVRAWKASRPGRGWWRKPSTSEGSS